MKQVIDSSKWEWFGVSAHFICGQWCRFHMATKVGSYLISTVGEYVHPSHSGGSEMTESKWLKENWPGEDIGYERKYETMVFESDGKCSIKGCDCGMPVISGSEVDFVPSNTRGEAQKSHMTMCRKYSNL